VSLFIRKGNYARPRHVDADCEYAVSQDISLLAIFIPEALVAGLFMTYRTFFILLDMMDNLVLQYVSVAVFLGQPFKNSTNISRGIGMLLIRVGRTCISAVWW